MPRVSVVLPCRDCAGTLREAADSTLAQTYRDFELLLIDDHSTDGTADVIADLAADGRVRALRNPGDGLIDALNFGLSEAFGELIARMDGDDVCRPERFAEQVSLLERGPALGIVGCLVELYRPEGGPAPGMERYVNWLNSLTDPAEIRLRRYVESPLAHPSAMGRREAFALGYRDAGWPEDYDLWLRMLREGWEIGKVARPLLRWRDEGTRLSRTHPRYSLARFRECKLAHLSAEFNLRRLYVWGAGRTGKPWLRLLVERGFTPEMAVDLHPRRIGTRVHGVPVVHPEEFVRRVRPGEGLSLIAVAEPSALPEIHAILRGAGFAEGRDYVRIA